ncbi:MAG: hypothetical protein OXE79_08465 [Acidimicrobiaceae bacterium]|nr:hypothetical protein [Acidimicrobiaceae bacterium]MCY4175671.1 hypothetical protein [Acidimicrobiaceae bacterium]
MALSQTISKTTTLRIPVELRDEISHLADRRGKTMVDVVTDAVQRLGRDEWWLSVRCALDDLAAADTADYRTESRCLDAAAGDGLDVG